MNDISSWQFDPCVSALSLYFVNVDNPNSILEKIGMKCLGYPSGDGVSVYKKEKVNMYKPTKVIVSGPVTTCYFADGEVVRVRQGKETEFSVEYAVAEAIVKHLYGSRNQFLKSLKSVYYQPTKEEKKARQEAKKAKKNERCGAEETQSK